MAAAKMFGAPPPDTGHTGDPAQILRTGRVQSVDAAAALCTVALGDPDGQEVETAEVAWATARAGETRTWSPPSVGEQVMLLCPGGDIAQAIALPALYCTAFPAPGSGTREFIRFGDGAEIGYDPDAQHCDIALPAGATMSLQADGGISITGDVAIEGNLSLQGDMEASGDVVASGISLASHRHTGVSAGSSISGGPQ